MNGNIRSWFIGCTRWSIRPQPRRSGRGDPVRRLLVVLWVLILIVPSAVSAQQGLLFSTPIRTPDEIHRMSDQELIGTFIDVMVDIEASTVFSQAAGFTKKDFERYRRLLKYRVYLIQEFQRRKLPIPKIRP